MTIAENKVTFDQVTATEYNTIAAIINDITDNGLNQLLSITIADTINTAALSLTQNDTTNNPNCLTITNITTGASIFIDQDGAGVPISIDLDANVKGFVMNSNSTQNAFEITIPAVLSSSRVGMLVDCTAANTNSGSFACFFRQDNSSSTRPVIGTQNDGTGSDIIIDHNGVTGIAIEIDYDGNDAAQLWAVQIVADNAGAGEAGAIDISSFTAGEKTLKIPTDNTSIDTTTVASTGRIAIDDGAGNIRYIPYFA